MRRRLVEGAQSEHLFNIVRNKIHVVLDEMELVGPILRLNATDVRRVVTTASAQALAERLYDDGFSKRDAADLLMDRMVVAEEAEEDEENEENEEEEDRNGRGVD